MRIRTLTTKAALVMVLLFAPATVAVAGHGEHEDHDSHKGAMDHAEDAVEAEAEAVEENVENAGAVMKGAYGKARAAGEGRIEAAGDGYTAVVEAGRDKVKAADEKKAAGE